MLEFESIFHQVALVLAVCTAIGLLASLLRQPPLVGFIAAGVLVGPQVFGLIQDPQDIQLLSKVGVSLLLFVVGLKLDLHLIRTVGPVALATGLGQVLFTSVVGYGIAIALGMPPLTALYVAVALTFSSTIIIVKLLSDKREIEELHGRIAIGFLIVQDIVVVLVMVGLSAVGRPEDGGVAAEAALVALRAVAFLGALAIAMRWLLPPLLHRLAHRPELLILFATTWAISLAAAGDIIGLGEEVGAFLAGVALASTPYREAIAGRLTSLRDFLVLFFFIDLGISFDLAGVGRQLLEAGLLSAFVLVGNPIIVMVIMGAMGYRRRVSFLAGLTVAQISEFSLILAALGAALGHIGGETVGLITAVGLITIGLSTYLIYNSHALYERLEPLLGVFERKNPPRGRFDLPEVPPPEVMVIGAGRFGGALVSKLLERGVEVMVVDFDPEALRAWAERGVPTVYGDAEDHELAGSLPLPHSGWVVCSVRRRDANLSLLHGLRQHGYRGRVALSAETAEEARLLEEAGGDLVLRPFLSAADGAVDAFVAEGRPD